MATATAARRLWTDTLDWHLYAESVVGLGPGPGFDGGASMPTEGWGLAGPPAVIGPARSGDPADGDGGPIRPRRRARP